MTTAALPAPGSFEAISVFDADHRIDLAKWIAPDAPARVTLDAFADQGWRLVTFGGHADQRAAAVFYDRVLDDYDDTCPSISILLSADGTYEVADNR